MPRMRTIKPEFWDSPSTARADLAVRLVYIAMWNWADDSGRGTANLKELEAFCFPNDDVAELPRNRRGNSAHRAGSWRNFAEVCGEVAEAYGVRFYKVHERPYYVIPNFKDHQAKDFRSKSKYPTEEQGYFYDVTSGKALSELEEESDSSGNSAHEAGNSAHEAGKTPLVIGEKGNRVTGENICASDDARESTYPQDFETWWNLYPKKVGKRKALTEYRKALKRTTHEHLMDKTRAFANFHHTQGTEKQFIKDPQGWLSRDGWDDELIPRTQQPTHHTTDTNTIDNWLGTHTPQIIDAEPTPTWTPKGQLT